MDAIKLTRNVSIDGKHHEEGEVLVISPKFSKGVAKQLIQMRKAVPYSYAPEILATREEEIKPINQTIEIPSPPKKKARSRKKGKSS